MKLGAFLGLMLVGACGPGAGAGDGGDLGAAVDGGDDQSVYRDAGPLVCGTAGVCPSSDTCCVTATPDGGAIPSCVTTCTGGFPVSCAGPGYCGGNPCCLQLQNTKAQSVTCTLAPTDCPPNINLSGTGMTRVCDTDGDCTSGAPNTMFDTCCHLTSNGYKICFNINYVPVTNGSIACP